MLSLREIAKTYVTGDTSVQALKGVSIDFRESEFVSILGPSGCGKTTLLNVIGGLDRYDGGDLIINGRSTKLYRDADWDTYRNHSIGFVFQSYNLISHQTVLSNVELALTLSGVSKEERRQRAIEALEKVGLGDQIHKKPNQMSGGQMQRVAIARALVNDPDILLADEPTGALDTQTSVQVMDILKEVAKTKLVIMVTHNPELADQYSTRIIRLRDGLITDDTDPYEAPVIEAPTATEEVAEASAQAPVVDVIGSENPETGSKKAIKKGKKSMSFLTALSLSLNNLLTKKTRTLLVSVAGSIGIIGIALILALSNGVNLFIAGVQEDTLSTYPLSIQQQTQDMSAMLGAMTAVSDTADHKDSNMIYVDDSLGTMMSAMSSTVNNNLEKFHAHLEQHRDQLAPYVTDIKYTYNFDLQIFTADGKTQVSPSTIFDNMGSAFSGVGELMGNMSVFSEMLNNQELLDQQYDVIAGNWPTNANEVVLVVSSNNQLSKMTLYMLGVLDQSELEGIMEDLMQNGEYDTTPMDPYTYDDFLNMSFRLLNTADFFEEKGEGHSYSVNGKTYPVWYDQRDSVFFDQERFVTENGIELKIAGIVRPKTGATATSISGAIGYTKALTDYILEQNTKSAVINQQKATPTYNVLTGTPFERTVYTKDNIDQLIRAIDDTTMEALYAFMTEQIRAGFAENPPVNAETLVAFAAMMDDAQITTLINSMLTAAKQSDANAAPLATLCGTLTSMLNIPDVAVTPDNMVELLPLMDMSHRMVIIAGIPASDTIPIAIPGLQSMCGTETMQGIYDFMNAELLKMSVNDSNFPTLLRAMDDDQFNTFQNTLYEMAPQMDATYDSNLELLGDAEKAKPVSINFYAVDFESKEYIEQFISDYNDQQEEVDKLRYTDLVGIMMSSVTTIVDAISYVLVAFVSISLVVSSIMIGIITYISVLERTKEIGILRAIGASKRDISRVFNAETLIIGFAAGTIGILTTVLLCLPINLILRAVTDMTNIRAVLPVGAAFILIAISMVLTLIAGLLPSRIASKKDPVEALRTE